MHLWCCLELLLYYVRITVCVLQLDFWTGPKADVNVVTKETGLQMVYSVTCCTEPLHSRIDPWNITFKMKW